VIERTLGGKRHAHTNLGGSIHAVSDGNPRRHTS
jgi:hypothetical protein